MATRISRMVYHKDVRVIGGGLLCCSLLLAACGLFGGDGSKDVTAKMAWDGRVRGYRVHIPDSYDADTPAPLILAFHGSNGTGPGFQEGSGFDDEADRRGFITIYPTSAVGNWAEGCGCNNADRLEIDDIGFAHALIDTVQASYAIDPARIYAVGFSQGALFVQRVACEMADRVSGVAAVAGTMSVPLSETCAPSQPVSMLLMHGTEDNVLPWGGTENGALSLLSALDAVDYWTDKDVCPLTPQEETTSLDGGRTLRRRIYGPCAGGSEVQLYEIRGGGHEWPRGDVDANKVVTTFFAGDS